MKNDTVNRIKVACQSGAIAIWVCLALPGQSVASDVELYQAPKSSETTLMFMLDVSGSMNPQSNDYSENRLQSLKNGMVTLLQGDSAQGISPLEDNLVVGLSTFNGSTGRIKLEAKPLGEPSPIAGQRPVFRTVVNYQQDLTRTRTTTTTQTDSQSRNQTASSECDGIYFILFGCWGSWVRDGNWNTPAWGTSTTSSSSSTNNSAWAAGTASQQGGTIAQECVAWGAAPAYACTSWVATTKQASDFAGYTTETTTTTPEVGAITSGTTMPGASTPVGAWSENNPAGSCDSSNCSRTQTRTRTRSTSTITPQNATQTYSETTIYGGVAYETHRKKLLREVLSLTANNGTPTAFAYAEVAAYLMGQSTSGESGSGFTESSVGDIRNNSTYIKPVQIDPTKQCNTQGIYFLTDGVPEYSNSTSARDITRATLDDTTFECDDTELTDGRSFYDGTISKTNWQCMAGLAKRLKNGTNPQGVPVLTAVVGFGSTLGETTGDYRNDVAAAKEWGTLGGGGYYAGSDDRAVVNSVQQFIKMLDKYIPPVTTGSATIPMDALDVQNVQPWAYFPQFDPKPTSNGVGVSTWLGNLKKFKTANNSLVDRNNDAITDSNGLLKDDLNDFWADTSIKKIVQKTVNGVDTNVEVKVGGALSRMILGYSTDQTPNERRIYTDRKIEEDPANSSQNTILTINSGNLMKVGLADFISSSTNKFKEDPKRGYLLSLFGYSIGKDLAYNLDLSPKETQYQTELESALSQEDTKRDWLMGAVMHSRPILLTQEGTTAYDEDTGNLTYDNRDDLVLFGTTQGVLHVMRAGQNATDNNGGKELFAFVPHEMIENQALGFLSQDNQATNLKYGIDGQWTAYTEYVTKATSNAYQPKVTVKGGKQWVYGGLRMGGKSYYALDLTDVSGSDSNPVPKLKFRISPSGTCSSGNPLGCMGQSWSKPTIAWVNWKGSRKLVMFVGGGYDMGYEVDSYDQVNGIGSGVYMFDADNGDLLWWASNNAANSNGSATGQAKKVDDMKYSVVSQIKTVDRNSDGLVDHLYFGDLGGQIWRVDINNAISNSDTTTTFAKRAIRLANLHESAGKSPRFYSTPTFTIHNGGNAGLFGVVSIGSGNLSLPMSATNHGHDAVYVIFDKDVAKPNLYLLADTELDSQNIAKGTTGNTLAANTNGQTKTTLDRGGWYYPFATSTKYRVLNDAVAIDSDLYVSVFDASVDLGNTGCSGGVRGESNVERFCLPYGQCTNAVTGASEARPNPDFLGKGNIGIVFGGGSNGGDRTLILNSPPTGSLPNYSGQLRLVSQRWYERYAQVN